MKAFLVLLTLTIAACGPKKTAEPEVVTPVAKFLGVLQNLATRTEPSNPSLDDQLTIGLPAIVDHEDEVNRRYLTRLTATQRTILAERLPSLVDRLTAGEPYLRIALAKQRRLVDASAPKRPWIATFRDYARIAVDRIRERDFAIRSFDDARAQADLILRFEKLVTAHAAAPDAPVSPVEDVVEALIDLGGDVAITPEYLAHLRDRLDRVESLDELNQAYRTTVPEALRIALAGDVPRLMAALLADESPAVKRSVVTIRGQRFGLTPERQLGRDLTTEFLKIFGRGLARRGIHAANAGIAAGEAATKRAVRWLRFEKMLSEGAEPTCIESLERAIRAL